MKITVTFALDINPDEWASQFPEDMDDLTANVTRYARNVAEGLFVDLGLANESVDA